MASAKIPGKPILTQFDLSHLRYRLEFELDSKNVNLNSPVEFPLTQKNGEKLTTDDYSSMISNLNPTVYTCEIFIPNFHYGDFENLEVYISDGTWEYNRNMQTLYWQICPSTIISRTPTSWECWLSSLSSWLRLGSTACDKEKRYWITISPPQQHRSIISIDFILRQFESMVQFLCKTILGRG